MVRFARIDWQIRANRLRGPELNLLFSEDFSRASTRKIAQNEGHEKANKKAPTMFFQADEGHEKATKKPRKSNE